MDRVYFDGMNGLSFINTDEDFHNLEENWDIWVEFTKENFSVYQYKDDAVINYWGVDPSEFSHDKEMQLAYDKLLLKISRGKN